jgi:SAM-dependent methyltransferase
MGSGEYTPEFFARIRDGSLTSARRVVPIVADLVAPRSVIDVGCGEGAWLTAFAEQNVNDLLGIDGDYVDSDALMIPEASFRAADLASPLELARTFDLALSLEVAEHLPPTVAAGFVRSLSALAPAVLFSAAIPGQLGTDHLNERWPSYWAGLFAEQGFIAFDVVRPSVWDDAEVLWWYAQNILLYVREASLLDERLTRRFAHARGLPRDLVHPRLYNVLRDRTETTRELLPKLPPALARSLRFRLSARRRPPVR